MLRRVVIGAALACLMAGAAYAVDDAAPPPPDAAGAPDAASPDAGAPDAGAGEDEEGGGDACSQALAATEEAVSDKLESNALSDADTDKVNELLDKADEQCTQGDMAGATQTLETVKTIVAKAK